MLHATDRTLLPVLDIGGRAGGTTYMDLDMTEIIWGETALQEPDCSLFP